MRTIANVTDQKAKPHPQVARTMGERIRDLRTSRGWRQKDLAVRVGDGVTQGMVSFWEKDKVEVSMRHTESLATVFGVTVEYLRSGQGIPKTGVGMLPDDLRQVVTSDEWDALPEEIQRALALLFTRVDLPEYEVKAMLAMLKRGHGAFTERATKRRKH